MLRGLSLARQLFIARTRVGCGLSRSCCFHHRLGTEQSIMAGGRFDDGPIACDRAGRKAQLDRQVLHQLDEELLAEDLGVKLDELADRTVVGLMTAANPPRADVAPGQAL